MPRRMSCSMTVDAVRDRTKTVTRRHPDTWTTLEPGDRLTLVEKGMGLPKGSRQVVLAETHVELSLAAAMSPTFTDASRLLAGDVIRQVTTIGHLPAHSPAEATATTSPRRPTVADHPVPRCGGSLCLTPDQAANAVYDAKERGRDVLAASLCERCDTFHMRRKKSLNELCDDLGMPRPETDRG